MRNLVLVLFLCLLTNCSALGAASKVIGAIGGGSSDNSGVQVESELVVGDKSSSSDVQLGNRLNAETINNIQEASPLIIFLLLLGWILPTPLGMWRYIKNTFGNS